MIHMSAIASLVAGLEMETNRLRIRRFDDRDVTLDIEHQIMPAIMRYIRVIPSVAQAAVNATSYSDEWVGVENEWCAFVVTLPDIDTMMGCVVFRIESVEWETAELGYRFHPDFHRQGYATEACEALVRFLFDQVDVHKITALCDRLNTPSLRLLERIGMQREAHLREYSRHDGEWQDAVEYGLFRDEFYASSG